MPKVRLLAPVTHEEKDFKTDDVISVDDNTANAWRAAGKASLFDYEQQLIRDVAEHGHYGDVTGREEVAQPKEDAEDPIPPAHRKGKK
jgi:hypothetical protein